MRDRAVSSLLALVIVAAPGCGCSPDATEEYQPSPEARAFAVKLCNTRHECECADGRFASYAECVDEVARSFDAQVEAGAKVDNECLDQALANESLNGCPAWPWDEAHWSCAALRYSRQLGDACSPASDLEPLAIENCGSGLTCLRGECRPSDEAGQPPTDFNSPGDPCTTSTSCVGGLYCGYDHRCHELAGLGEQCEHAMGCEIPAYCEGLGATGVGVCAPRKQPGEPCDPRDWVPCDSPNFPDVVNACDPTTNTCAPDQPGICRLTHALIARQG